jgi:hypothetical protein
VNDGFYVASKLSDASITWKIQHHQQAPDAPVHCRVYKSINVAHFSQPFRQQFLSLKPDKVTNVQGKNC